MSDDGPGSVPIPSQPSTPRRRAFHAAAPEDVARYWSSDLEAGLAPDEAERRLVRLGPNKLAEAPRPGILSRLLEQVAEPTVLALLFAAAIATALSIFSPEPGAGLLARFGDGAAILLIVVINAALGLIHGQRAERALLALRDLTSPSARIIRGGVEVETPATLLVPGDVLLLEEGDKVAADVRLVQVADLEIEEATLTGESAPVGKDPVRNLPVGTPLAERVNMAFMGTRATRGRGRGVVCNTGMYTELGAIAGLLAQVKEERTPLQVQLDGFGRQIVVACVLVSAVVFAAGLLTSQLGARQLFLVAVSLAVAAIPEGLPAITTIVLALGTTRMARRNALVRRLPAVETLGSVQVICTDKTGTLTQNLMAVRRVFAGGRAYEVDDAVPGRSAVIREGTVPGPDGVMGERGAGSPVELSARPPSPWRRARRATPAGRGWSRPETRARPARRASRGTRPTPLCSGSPTRPSAGPRRDDC